MAGRYIPMDAVIARLLRHLIDRATLPARRALLRTRIAQLRTVASAMSCTSAGDALYQASLYGKASIARRQLAALELAR